MDHEMSRWAAWQRELPRGYPGEHLEDTLEIGYGLHGVAIAEDLAHPTIRYPKPGAGAPVVYVWVAFPERHYPIEPARRRHPGRGPARVLYVGQTIDLQRRTRQHIDAIARGTVGRECHAIRAAHPLPTIMVGWRVFECDCPLDYEERAAIQQLRPLLNQHPGIDRARECDRLCPIRLNEIREARELIARHVELQDRESAFRERWNAVAAELGVHPDDPAGQDLILGELVRVHRRRAGRNPSP